MVETLIFLAPLLLLAIVVLFGFTGCGKPLPLDEPAPSPSTPPSTPPTPPPPVPYATVVAAEQGFVVHWGLNETTGTTALATPASLNLNGQYQPGTAFGASGAFSSKEPGNFAPTLNGGYVEVPFSPLLNVDQDLRFSVEVWARPLGPIAAGVEQILISSHHTAAGGNQRGYEIALVGNGAAHATVRGRVFSTVGLPVTVDITPTQGDPVAWKHIVLTYDGSGGPLGKKLRLWVSVTGAPATNTQEASGDYSPVQNNQRTLRFGAGHLQAGGPEKLFAGLVDEVAFYNVVLPKVTVEDHFKRF